MIRLLVAIKFLVLMSVVQAAKPPEISTTEKYVQVALAASSEQLKGQGSVKCSYQMLVNNYGKDDQYEAFADNHEVAIQLLVLQCVKKRCTQVGQWALGGLNQLDQTSDADNTEFMKAQGLSDEEILRALINRRTIDRGAISQMTCETSNPLWRMLIVDTCLTQPIACVNAE